MPSLRRTLSSPSVRTSPYRSFLSGASSSSSSGSSIRQQGHGHRRSSGSDTANRRVLADLDWWKVTDGQCDLDSNRPEARNRGQDAGHVGRRVMEVAPQGGAGDENVGVAPSPSPVAWTAPSFTESAPTQPTTQPPIAPRTPLRRHRTEPALCFSSLLEEPTPTLADPVDRPCFGLPLLDFGPELVLPPLPECKPTQTKELPSLSVFCGDFSEILSFDEEFDQFPEFAPTALSPYHHMEFYD